MLVMGSEKWEMYPSYIGSQVVEYKPISEDNDVWERPPTDNLPQTPHSAGAYSTGYVLSLKTKMMIGMGMWQCHWTLSSLVISWRTFFPSCRLQVS
jgi:hypothetical protein